MAAPNRDGLVQNFLGIKIKGRVSLSQFRLNEEEEEGSKIENSPVIILLLDFYF
jgi:hypothetical protein